MYEKIVQKSFHVYYVYYLFSQKFLYFTEIEAKLPKVRNNLFEQVFSNGIALFLKTRATYFNGMQRKENQIYVF